MGYHADIDGAVLISDCYCIARAGSTTVCFCAYTEFDVVVLDVYAGTQHLYPLPEELHGAMAISTDGRGFFLHGSYEARTEMTYWVPGSAPVRLGHVHPLIRGRWGGEFMRVTETGYETIHASLPGVRSAGAGGV